jgi:drug/metabolite transporter (DMT)-like permease
MKIKTKEREGELFALGVAVLESWFPIFSIVSISYIGALYTYTLSLMIALVFFVALMIKRHLFAELSNKAAYRDLFLTTFFITSLFVLVFIGMRHTTAGNMAVIIFLQLLFSYLYFNVLGREKMDKTHTLGAVIMAVGALIILIPEDMRFNRGDWYILLAAAIAPIANLYQKRARKRCSSETILIFRTVVGLPVIALMAYLFEPLPKMDQLLAALPYLFFIGTVVYVLSKIMWIEAIHRLSITKMSAMMALVPMLTLFFAYLYLDETPTFRQLLGIAPIVAGGYMLTKR